MLRAVSLTNDYIAEEHGHEVMFATVFFGLLDPETGRLPYDPFAGFLPPEDGTGRGQGYVAFAVEAKEPLDSGTNPTSSPTLPEL